MHSRQPLVDRLVGRLVDRHLSTHLVHGPSYLPVGGTRLAMYVHLHHTLSPVTHPAQRTVRVSQSTPTQSVELLSSQSSSLQFCCARALVTVIGAVTNVVNRVLDILMRAHVPRDRGHDQKVHRRSEVHTPSQQQRQVSNDGTPKAVEAVAHPPLEHLGCITPAHPVGYLRQV